LDQALDRLIRLLIKAVGGQTSEALDLPTKPVIALAIEKEIRHAIEAEEERQKWQPLLSFLKLKATARLPIPPSAQRRLASLAEQLAFLFFQYGHYAGEMVKEWNDPQGWQESLWCRLFDEQEGWNYPYQTLSHLMTKISKNLELPQKPQIHLFAMSFLSRLHHQFFAELSKILSINHYAFSPCMAFWSDIRSDKECRQLRKFWKGRGSTQEQQIALEDLLRNRNRLLANFGRLGRETALYYENSDSEMAELYVLPKSVADQPQYCDMLADHYTVLEEGHRLTLLEAVQADILLMRNPETTEKLNLAADDTSIQLHVAPSRLREVQVLYDRLLAIINDHAGDADPITPRDIVVMAPDITSYEPAIKMVFEALDSQLDIHIVDLPFEGQSPLVSGFWKLIDLAEGRWEPSTLLEIFENPFFQQCHQISNDDVAQLRLWVRQQGIRWGKDAGHRNEVLLRNHCFSGIGDDASVGTWEAGIDRLLRELAVIDTDEILSVPLIASTQGSIIGKWLRILRSLRDDLRPLVDGTHLSLSEWSCYLRSLLEAYCAPYSLEEPGYTTLLEQVGFFERISQRSSRFVGASFSFVTIKKQLKSLIKDQTSAFQENHIQAVRFCSMLPMRAIPAKVVCLLGMNKGDYPRQELVSSLNLMRQSCKADYCPSRVDYDRYLFLEALLSARRYFLIGCHSSSCDEENATSLLVQELFDYVDRTCSLDGETPSQRCWIRHPFYSFDAEYFDRNNHHLRNFSHLQYQAAKAFYHQEKLSPHRFIPEFYEEIKIVEQSSMSADEIFVDLKQLVHLASNPIRAYLRNSLKIYLDDKEEWNLPSDENFVLPAFEAALLRREALSMPVTEIPNLLKDCGERPLGIFGKVAIEKLQNQVEQWKKNLTLLGVDHHEIFDVKLQPNCDQPTQMAERLWVVPSIHLLGHNGVKIHVVGTLRNVTHRGLWVPASERLTEVVKYWPQYLALCCSSMSHVAEKSLLMGKSGKILQMNGEDLMTLLKDYIDYHLVSEKQASPLVPEWILPIIKGDAVALEKKIDDSIKDMRHGMFDHYVRWILVDEETPNAHHMITSWQKWAKRLYEPMILQWFPKLMAKS